MSNSSWRSGRRATPGLSGTKAGIYSGAGVPYFWEVNEDRMGALTLVTHVLKDGQYVEDLTATPGTTVTVHAAPVPVTFGPAVLHP